MSVNVAFGFIEDISFLDICVIVVGVSGIKFASLTALKNHLENSNRATIL